MEGRIMRRACLKLKSSQKHQSAFARRVPLHARHASTQRLEQRNPLGDYYESLLLQPLTHVTSVTRQPITPSPLSPLPKTDEEERTAKARIVFGSRSAGPAERRSEIERKSTLIAGVLVPPRPEEPDNCCMGGCVNCVYDRYREELQEWSAARKAADASLRKEKGEPPISNDRDEAGGDKNQGTGLDPDLFKGIPVGILEFMKTEKLLKERHARRVSGV